jgi:hypothetical protein
MSVTPGMAFHPPCPTIEMSPVAVGKSKVAAFTAFTKNALTHITSILTVFMFIFLSS